MLSPDAYHLEILAAQTRALAIELERLVNGRAPTLDEAPRLDHWRLAHRSVPMLMGRVHGHPILGNHRQIHTSQLYAMDPEAGWARTPSRYYRLGKPWDGPLLQSSVSEDPDLTTP